jgi:transcription antitermination factor NusG
MAAFANEPSLRRQRGAPLIDAANSGSKALERRRRGRSVDDFNGYLFVRVVDRWRILERTIGVLSVVKFGAAPARCPDEEIAKLIARTDADGIIRLPPHPPGASPASRILTSSAGVSRHHRLRDRVSFGVGSERRSTRQLVELFERGGVKF